VSAASGRRNLRRENVRQLSQREPGLSHRQIADRLGISKDTVRRDLDALAQEPGADGAAPIAPVAPQISGGGAEPAAFSAPPAEPGGTPDAPPANGSGAESAEPDAPVAPPADPAQDEPVFRIRLARRPRLLSSLCALREAGLTPAAVIDTVLAAFVGSYRQALARGELKPGERYQVTVRVRRAA
jgi:DNA-binding transcriptional MocR family regulator